MAFLLVIESSHRVGFYTGAKPSAAPDLSFNRMVDAPEIYGSLSIGGGSENANMTIKLDNGDGAISQLFAKSVPVLTAATLYSDGAEVFGGEITEIEFGTTIKLRIEA